MARADIEKKIDLHSVKIAAIVVIANSIRRDTGVSIFPIMRDRAKELGIPNAELISIHTLLARLVAHEYDLDQFFGECAIKWIEKL